MDPDGNGQPRWYAALSVTRMEECALTGIRETSAFVTAQWLAAQPTDNVVILDCRFRLGNKEWGRDQYREGHVPGAIYADLEQDLSGPLAAHGGRHPLPQPGDFASFAARIGVGPETHVVAYDEAGEMAARCWWLFRYFSHDRASVLKGGFQSWLQAGLPLAAGEHDLADRAFKSTISAGATGANHFAPQLSWLATHDDVRSAVLRGAVGASLHLVDSRAPERYRGEVEPLDPVAGHIPGARNLLWSDAFQGAAMLRPQDELRAHFSPVLDGKPIVVYCGSGVTASANALALHELGVQARVYAGSFSDWCSYGDDPIATGDEW